jgi:UDP-N-acetylmuramate dehydrogenase
MPHRHAGEAHADVGADTTDQERGATLIVVGAHQILHGRVPQADRGGDGQFYIIHARDADDDMARILTEEGEGADVDCAYFRFGYDDSVLHHRDDIVLTATFRLTPALLPELRAVIRANLQWRDDRHPDLWLYPSAGSIFRKIADIGAGRLIDQCGLKGHVHGGAGIFHRHANIIVNLGGATAREVRELIDLCQRTVHAQLGYELVPEIRFVGEF